MFNSHQYITQDIMDKEDFAAAWRIIQQQVLTQDQHWQQVFVNANAGLAYITVPCHGRPPRTRLIAVPPPFFDKWCRIITKQDSTQHSPTKKLTDPWASLVTKRWHVNLWSIGLITLRSEEHTS